MTIYKTLEEVQKDYPNLDINKFNNFEKRYLINNESCKISNLFF